MTKCDQIPDSIDCGIRACGWCNGPGCQRLGTATTFLVILSLAGFVQGGIEAYFRVSAHQAANEHDFDPAIVDWLLVTSGISQGVFALLVAYWGNRLHRISWLGGIFMLQAVGLLLLIIPTLTHKYVIRTELCVFCDMEERARFIAISAKGVIF